VTPAGEAQRVRLKGILFDLDGTLFAREAAFWSWVRDEAAARELDWATIAELDARGRGPKLPLLEHLALALGWPERSLEARLQRARRGMLRYAQPDQRLSQLLTRLGRSFRLGVVTNGASESQRGKLRAMQIEQHFEPVIVSAEVGHRKPEFAIFRLATRGWQLPHAEVLFVGDDPLADVGGARGAGMLPLQVLREPVEPAELEGLGLLPNAHEPSDGTASIRSLWQLESWLAAHADAGSAP
jgi:putative hydrolase of the HAD superfamily